MARPGATHRTAAPSHTPATRDRTGRLHRDVHGRPAACRHPGVPAGLPSTPCTVTLDQLHRQEDGPRAAGTTDGDASAPRQSRKTLSAAEADDFTPKRRCINIRVV